MLLTAADADGQRAHVETRPIRVGLGNAVVDAMVTYVDALDPAARDAILQASLPHFLAQPKAREKLQRLLRDLFMAEGEYGPAEQAMTRKIGDWIRAASQSDHN